VFVTVSHFPKGLVFVVTARSLPLEWSPVRGSTQVGSYLGNKFWTRVEVTDSVKCSSLLRYRIHYGSERFYSIVPGYDESLYKNISEWNNAIFSHLC
jgi:hypothetical protein